MTLLIIDMDFLYQFNMGLIAPLFTVSFHEKFEKKMFFKIFKSWQVCDWLAKWIIMLRFLDLRWPRVFRLSNVGLVNLVIVHLSACILIRWRKSCCCRNTAGSSDCTLQTPNPVSNLPIPAWISNHMPSKVCDEMIYTFPDFNGIRNQLSWTIEVWE